MRVLRNGWIAGVYAFLGPDNLGLAGQVIRRIYDVCTTHVRRMYDASPDRETFQKPQVAVRLVDVTL